MRRVRRVQRTDLIEKEHKQNVSNSTETRRALARRAPGRQNLVPRFAHREETLKAYQAASAAVDRLRSMIEDETKAKAALADLERTGFAAAPHGRAAIPRRSIFRPRKQLTPRGARSRGRVALRPLREAQWRD